MFSSLGQKKEEGKGKQKENKGKWAKGVALPSEDGEEGTIRVLESLAKVFELLLHEETGGLVWGITANHRTMRSVRGSKSIVHIHISQLGQRRAERAHFLRGGLGLAEKERRRKGEKGSRRCLEGNGI